MFHLPSIDMWSRLRIAFKVREFKDKFKILDIAYKNNVSVKLNTFFIFY